MKDITPNKLAMDPRVSPEEVQRGADALVPFVHAFDLSLNPEELDEMAYAVLLHSKTNDSWEEVEAAVNAQIAEFKESLQRMRIAMQKDAAAREEAHRQAAAKRREESSMHTQQVGSVELEPHLEKMRQEVHEVRSAILQTLPRQKEWSPKALQEHAVDQGHSSIIASVAFWGLVEDGIIELDNMLVARARLH